MNIVLYFSPTHSTKLIAEYASSYLNSPCIDLTSYQNRNDFDYSLSYESIILCFPVYSQNITVPVKDIIKNIKSKYIVFLITYGRMSVGNTLYEAKILTNSTVLAGAYIPTKHTYKEGEFFKDLSVLNILLDKIRLNDVSEVQFPKLKKNVFANFFPDHRSRIGVKLIRTQTCIDCSICNDVCPTYSVKDGLINNKTCIRCLSCHFHCPHSGLNVKYSKFLKLYLKKDKKKKTLLYY